MQIITVVLVILVILALVTLAVSVCGYLFRWRWTGVVKDDNFPYKTFWDWLGLLIVPVLLASGAILFAANQDNRLQHIEQKRARAERRLEEQRTQDEALQIYLDQMSQLILESKLPESKEGSAVRELARARTLTVLDRIDPDRKTTVVRFLFESGLIHKDHAVVDLKNADLREIHIEYRNLPLHDVDLSKADLTGSILQDVELMGADMQAATLYEAKMQNAYLKGADLSHARLGSTKGVFNLIKAVKVQEAADLNGADLSDANLDWAFLYKVDMSPIRYRADMSPEMRTEQRTDLSGAKLRNAVLVDADLRAAILDGSNFTCADLKGADFTNATGMTKEQIASQALYLGGATAPDGSSFDIPYGVPLRECPNP